MDDFSTNPARVILQICVTDLPGCPQNRHNTLADIFCRQVLNRRCCYELQLPAYDYMHIPPHFDTDKPVRRWFVLDLNVQSRLSRDEVLSLPHAVYSVSWQENRWYINRLSHLSIMG